MSTAAGQYVACARYSGSSKAWIRLEDISSWNMHFQAGFPPMNLNHLI